MKGRPTGTQNRSRKSFRYPAKMARREACTTWENLCFSYIGPGGRFHPFLCCFLYDFGAGSGAGKPEKTCIFPYMDPALLKT